MSKNKSMMPFDRALSAVNAFTNNDAIEILNEVSDIEKITVRQIAERAKVGIGTINYRFNSKDNLLSFAVGEVMANKINKFLKPQQNSHLDPVENLKTMLKEKRTVQ